MKKIISAIAVISLAATMCAPAFAILTPDGEPVIQGDIMLLSEGVEVGEGVIGEGDVQTPIIVLPGQNVAAPRYTKAEVEIVRIMTDDEEKGIMYKTEDSDDAVQADVTETQIFDIEGNVKEFSDITEAGGKAYIFIDSESETEDIAYIVIKDEDVAVNVAVDGFTASQTLGEYVDTQNFLAINIGEDTEIVDVEGNELTADDVADKYLMVFYDKMTMSIPAIATPVKVIVLGDYEPAEEPTVEPEATEEPEEEEPVYAYVLTVNQDDIMMIDDTAYIPVRKYAESLDLEVTWYDEDMSVTIGTVPMGVGFKIDENSYSKSKMTPFVLEGAPKLVEDTTYVPVSFFEQVLESKVEIFTNTEIED